jgi:hypothetical protein
MATRGINSPDIFCYICGQFVIKKQRRNIQDFEKKAYYAHFGMKLGDKDKSWAPHKVCCICVEELRQWTQGMKKSLPFGIPMIWREPGNHSDDCYFCSCNVQGYTSKNKKQSALMPGAKNIAWENLVHPQKVLLPLHTKLGLMKQFVKALQREENCFKYLCSKFPGLSEAKLKEGSFVGPDIRKLISDEMFETTMSNVEIEAWIALKDIISKFLGNYRDQNYKNFVNHMLDKFKELGCNMSLKVHFSKFPFGLTSRTSWSR